MLKQPDIKSDASHIYQPQYDTATAEPVGQRSAGNKRLTADSAASERPKRLGLFKVCSCVQTASSVCMTLCIYEYVQLVISNNYSV